MVHDAEVIRNLFTELFLLCDNLSIGLFKIILCGCDLLQLSFVFGYCSCV